MGSCATKSKKAEKSFSFFKIPEFFYVDRNNSLVLAVSPGGCTKVPINMTELFLPDCLIAYANEKSIYLVGGHKSNGKLSKKCFHVDLASNSVKRIQNLPKTFSYAELIPDTTQLLLVTKDKFSIYSYNLKKDSWSQVDVTFNQSQLAELTDFSCCLHNQDLMVVCGKYSKKKYSSDIYCVGIHKAGAPVFRFNLKFPEFLDNPRVVCTKEYKIVGGGKNPNGRPNDKFYIKSVNEDWSTVDCSNFTISEDYPALVIQGVPFFVSGRNLLACFKNILTAFWIPEYEMKETKPALQEMPTDKEVSPVQDKKRKKSGSESSEESAPVYSRSISELSGSYILRARVLTPVNQTFRETISSYDSGLSSQKLFSDEEDPEKDGQILLPAENPPEYKTVSSSKYKQKLNILNSVHSIEVLLKYETVEDFMLFVSDLFKIKNFRLPVVKPEKFSLYELEGILRKLRFRLYPIETFKLIIKSLDILFAMKNEIGTEERNYLKKLAGVGKRTEFVKKENLINAVGFRIKLAVIGIADS